MIQITEKQILQLAPRAGVTPAGRRSLVDSLNMTFRRYGIGESQRRVRYFLAQTSHETAGFTKLEESLYYTDPVRIASIFRSGFDTNRNQKVDPEEIVEAQRYARNPQALANRVYANRYGNGDEASGDGWRYRGSGLIHLTFKDNYAAVSQRLLSPSLLVEDPDKLRDLTDFLLPALTAGDFWDSRGLNELADRDRFTDLSAVIQGNTSTVSARLGELRKANAITWG